ncbi:hypothetical protein ABH940_000107 [Streptacidiphilus sp. BW17]|jgi:hypothetical protein|uniref:DUF397 domain-containing protein n=1 Tax=Streptacidiphilus sp. BW17 TaxID=3156274 RepID=UPI0035141611
MDDRWDENMAGYSNGVSAADLDAKWIKARASNANGQCVELALLNGGQVAVRNSTDPSGPALIFTPGEIEAFLDGARRHEFDQMVAL